MWLNFLFPCNHFSPHHIVFFFWRHPEEKKFEIISPCTHIIIVFSSLALLVESVKLSMEIFIFFLFSLARCYLFLNIQRKARCDLALFRLPFLIFLPAWVCKENVKKKRSGWKFEHARGAVCAFSSVLWWFTCRIVSVTLFKKKLFMNS